MSEHEHEKKDSYGSGSPNRFARARDAAEGKGKGLEKKAQGASAPMDMAAYMDALGISTKEIADVIGVHIKTVSHWRGTQDYMERVGYWRERELEKFEPLLHKLKIEALNLVDVAIGTLVDTMKNAVLADGRPNYAMREKAALDALNSSIVRLTIGADAAAVGTQINASQQTVTLVFNEAPPEPGHEIIDQVADAELDTVTLETDDDKDGEAKALVDQLANEAQEMGTY